MDNLGAQLAALELRCARLTAQAARIEEVAGALCTAQDVPPWAKRLLIDTLNASERHRAVKLGPRAARRLADEIARRVVELLRAPQT